MTREEAYKLLTGYITNKNLIKHSLAAEAAMKKIYKFIHKEDYSQKDEDIWGITGLLHDLDYEVSQKEDKLDKHGILLFEKDPNIIPEPMAHAIKSHNYKSTKVLPASKMDWAITCVDGLTGLIVSSALIHSDKKLGSIDINFVINRFNTPSFSRGVDREIIKLCEDKLSIDLREFISLTLSGMQEIASDLGL
ncbi:MAG: phosphohydrolase [Candidatus Levybacteria bacterium]|nr:phosphohydrolase [Candidatus Levybacteria bacterium]